jgi:pimeloyl-ACP methyl ester carboxylesterase
MKTHTVSGGGRLQLHVRETGNPNGKPILFIHGFSQCRLAWNKQMHSDLANDFRLLALDIRGHGLSEKPRDVYGDSKLWADDVHAVIAALGLDKPVLSGWSYGGVIMSDYVNAYGEDQIAGTNWVGAVSRLGDPLLQAGFIGTDFLSLAPSFFSDSVEESVTALQKFMRLCVHAEPSPEDFYFFLGYNVIVPPHVRLGLFSRHLNNDPVIAKMRKPMLLSYGEQDAIVLLSMGQHIARLAKHAKLSVYPSVGHAPFWEAPERFNRELREFREAA